MKNFLVGEGVMFANKLQDFFLTFAAKFENS